MDQVHERQYFGNGFEEVSPNNTKAFFSHLVAGDKVVIVSRQKDGAVKEYVQVLQDLGLQVRVVSQSTGVQDFCFLQQARKGFVGGAVSTFARWAALLGNAETIQLYVVNGRGMRASGNTTVFSLFQDIPVWTNRELHYRVKFPIVPSVKSLDG